MLDIIKNAWLFFKTAFMTGKAIGEEGRQKDFAKNPIKTIREVQTNGGRNKNYPNRTNKT